MRCGNYVREMPEYGDLMTVTEFSHCVETGLFIDYDGDGVAVIQVDGVTKLDCPNTPGERDYRISPSTISNIPEDATHIVWFNR